MGDYPAVTFSKVLSQRLHPITIRLKGKAWYTLSCVLLYNINRGCERKREILSFDLLCINHTRYFYKNSFYTNIRVKIA